MKKAAILCFALGLLLIIIWAGGGNKEQQLPSSSRRGNKPQSDFTYYFLSPGELVTEGRNNTELIIPQGERIEIHQLGEGTSKIWVVYEPDPNVSFYFTTRNFTSGPTLSSTKLALKLDKSEKTGRWVRARVVR